MDSVGHCGILKASVTDQNLVMLLLLCYWRIVILLQIRDFLLQTREVCSIKDWSAHSSCGLLGLVWFSFTTAQQLAS